MTWVERTDWLVGCGLDSDTLHTCSMITRNKVELWKWRFQGNASEQKEQRATTTRSWHIIAVNAHHTTSYCTTVQLYTAQRTMYTVVYFFADMTRTNNCTINDLARPLTCIVTTRQRCCSNMLKRTTVTWVMSNLAGATRTIYNASLDSRSAEKHLLRSTVTSQSVDVAIVYWYRKLTTNIISQMSRRHTQYKRHKNILAPLYTTGLVFVWLGSNCQWECST